MSEAAGVPVSTHSDPDRVRLEPDTLYAVVGVVASSPDLDRVLDGIVELLGDATRCHACFVYLRDGEQLRLRAASRVYRHLVGQVEFGLHEGLAGWVARRREPAFIRENAMEDPRMKYVPELEEEHFESMVAVPVPARSGETIGVVVLHTEAPREFDEGVLTFLAHTASLVAGAIENAQLFEGARRRVQTLTRLSALSQEIAGAATREQLYRVVTEGIRRLLDCRACRLYLLEGDAGRLELAAEDSTEAAPGWPAEGTSMLLDLLRRRNGASPLIAAPVSAGDEHLGVLAVAADRPLGDEDDELLRGIGHQLAVALKKSELIERLTAENVVRELFDALEAGVADVAEARARVAGCDLTRRHVVVHVELPAGHDDPRPWPAVAERTEGRLRRLVPDAVCDAGRDSLRALLPMRHGHGTVEDSFGALCSGLRELGSTERILVGVGEPRRGVDEGRRSLSEAADAAQIARALVQGGGALAYRDLGAYRYLVRLPVGQAPDERHDAAVQRLLEYDRKRRSELVATLEQYLRDRRSITTARALYIHPNTLRQRLERIESLCELELESEDLVSLELALKLARLRAAVQA